MERHEVLRTKFEAIDGNPVQVICPAGPIDLPALDLTAYTPEQQAAEVDRQLVAESSRPFDLTRDLMVRASLIRLSPEEHVLLWVIHHIASDGWSRGLLFRDFSELYRAFASGETPSLPELPIQYSDFAQWQRQWLQDEALESRVAYWKQQLEGVPLLELPADRPRPPVQTYNGGRQAVVVPQQLTEALLDLGRREGATLYMVVMAAFNLLLYRYSGQEDITIGSPAAGRSRLETENLIGFFINNLVVRTDLSDRPSFRELLRRVRDVTLDAFAHQDLPFDKLIEELQPQRSLSHTPLFQVALAFQNTPQTTLELAGLTLSFLEVNNGTAKYDLTRIAVEQKAESRHNHHV